MTSASLIPPGDVERLKREHPSDTRALVREVANRLFLVGERPTRALVREITGRGSMTTIDAGLREWWEALRVRTDAKIDVPGVPDALVPLFQQALTDLWATAAAEGKALFDEDRAAMQALADTAAAAEVAAHALVQSTQASLDAMGAEVGRLKAALGDADRALGAERHERAAVTGKLDGALTEATKEREAFAAERARQEQAMAALAAERIKERETLDGQLAFATRQIDEAREKAKALQADVERERRQVEAERQRAAKLDAVVVEVTRMQAAERATSDARQAVWDAERSRLIEDGNKAVADAVDAGRREAARERKRAEASEQEAKALREKLASNDMLVLAEQSRRDVEIAALRAKLAAMNP